MTPLYLLLGLLALLTASVRADSISTIQLQNRPAVEIIPIIQPMLGPNDSVSGKDYQLFLRASPATQAQIEDMISKLDVAAKLLLISVFQGDDRDLRALDIGGGMKTESNDATVGIDNRRNNLGTKGGNSTSYGTRNSSSGNTTFSTRGRLRDNPIHQLRVTDGTEGYIETGEQIPYFSARYGGYGFGLRNEERGVEFKDVTTGFYVLPRTHGNNVTIHVSPFKQTKSESQGGNIDSQRARTTITGSIGEWLPVGGTTEQTQRERKSNSRYNTTQSRDNESIWIKADLIQ